MAHCLATHCCLLRCVRLYSSVFVRGGQPLVELWCLQVLFWLLPGKSIIDLMMTTFGKFTM